LKRVYELSQFSLKAEPLAVQAEPIKAEMQAALQAEVTL
jgi:hypothetical protein